MCLSISNHAIANCRLCLRANIYPAYSHSAKAPASLLIFDPRQSFVLLLSPFLRFEQTFFHPTRVGAYFALNVILGCAQCAELYAQLSSHGDIS